LRYPVEPEVGVGSLVVKDGKILLVRRANPPGAGLWSVPGGHLKLGESIYQAAIRELEEETGITGRPVGIANIDEYVEYDEKDKVVYHYVLIDVLIEPDKPIEEVRPATDVLEVGVFGLKEALNLKLTRSTRSLVEKLVKGGVSCIIGSNFIVLRK